MSFPVITLLLISAPLAEPNSLTVKGEPLLEVIESRLAAVDDIVRRKEDRLARPTDKWFRYRFYSRSLADSVQPAFPAGLPGTIPLLEHADPRVRFATLLIMQKWLDQTQRSYQPIPVSALSEADWQRLRLALLNGIAHPQLKDTSPVTDELAVQIFSGLAKTPLTESEERVLLQKLKTKDQRIQRQIVQLFLTVKPVRFPDALHAPMRQLLGSTSTERSRIVLVLQALDKAPPELQTVLRDILKRDPHAWHAGPLAMLLNRSGACWPEMVPGLIRVFNRQIPLRGGMIGRGSMSLFVPGRPNHWNVLKEREQAGRALMTLPVDEPQVVPQLMTMLDADDYGTRAVGVAAISRFRSAAIIALPKLLTMNMTDTRPRGRITLGVRIGLGPAVFYSVKHIVGTSLMDLHSGNFSPLFISVGSLLADHLTHRSPDDAATR